MAKKDIDIGGQRVQAGEGIIAPLAVTNRDPEKFAYPDKFDIRRDARGHLAFGFGVHQCLGQPLARLELQVVFSKLFQRFPTLRLAIPHDKVPYKNSMIYGIESLPVTW